MKKFLLAGSVMVALSGVTGSAFAADPMPISDWTGGYVGVNIGYGHENWTISYYDFQTPAGGSKTVSDDNILGGVQAGYNLQSNNFVYGLESDIQLSGLNSNQKGGFSFDSCGCFNVSMPAFGTLRARAGVLVDPNVLLYGTGGLIVGDLSYSVADSSPFGTATSLAVGWTAGLGTEFKVNDTMSIKAEGLYYDFGSPHFDFGATRFNTNVGINGYIGRVGFNIHF